MLIDFTIFNVDEADLADLRLYNFSKLSDKYESVLNPCNRTANNHIVNISLDYLKEFFGIFSHSPNIFKNNDRKIGNLIASSGVVIDFDETETIESFEKKIAKLKLNYILYTSKSHKLKGNDRFHVFFPFEKQIKISSPSEFNQKIKDFIYYLETEIGLDIDKQVSDCSRLIYQSQSVQNRHYQFKAVLDNIFCDFIEGWYFLSANTEKSVIKTSERVKTVSIKDKVNKKIKYKRKTKKERKLSLYLNPLKEPMSITESKKFFKEHLQSFIIDDRYIKNRDGFGETMDNKYVMTLFKSALFLLKEHRYITRDSRTMPVRYLQSLIGLLCTFRKPRIDELIEDFKMSCFVESHNKLNITILSNKHFSMNPVSFNEVITKDDINKLLNHHDVNLKVQPKLKNYKFSIQVFTQILCILYSSKHTTIYDENADTTEIGYNQQKRIAEQLGITKQSVSKTLAEFDKLYYCKTLAEFESIEEARNYVSDYKHETDTNIRFLRLEKSGRFVVYKMIGSRCILDKDVFRIKNYRVVDGEFKGKNPVFKVDNKTKTTKQDVRLVNNQYVFYHNGKEVINYKTDFNKGVSTRYKENKVDIFVYISKKSYKTNNIAYCSLGRTASFFTEEDDKKSSIYKDKAETWFVKNPLPEKKEKYKKAITENSNGSFRYESYRQSREDRNYKEAMKYLKSKEFEQFAGIMDYYDSMDQREKEFYKDELPETVEQKQERMFNETENSLYNKKKPVHNNIEPVSGNEQYDIDFIDFIDV